MKKTINYSLILSLLFVLVVIPVSCSKESATENPQRETDLPLVKISGEHANIDTKTTLNGVVTSWIAATDKVGIYSSQARTATAEGGSEVVNAEFTAASSGVNSSFNGTMYWGAANTSHTFYAYYPYAAGSPASTVVPVSLAAAQTQASANSNAHLDALDFLVATPVTVTSPNNTNPVANDVNLSYNHLFTVLEFQIKGTGQLKAVKLSSNSTLAFSGGTINITQATPGSGIAYTLAGLTGTSSEAVVTLTTPATLTATNTDTKVYMVINPGTPTGNCTIELSVDGTTWSYLLKAVPVGGFKRGIKYVVSVDASSASALGTGEVVSLTGKVWMDRNLGATRVAQSSTDADAYGDLYQWGRAADGHQIRTSGTTPTLADSDTPGHANFILATSLPYDWRSPKNDNLWQGVSGTNNPCPSGFRIPTSSELTNERLSWGSNNSAGAFASPLKLPLPGNRSSSNSSINYFGTQGRYWSSTVTGNYMYCLSLISSAANSTSTDYRGYGLSVRCIKD
ncbi:MAG: fimbrillin family protein [Bacteroidales bacterium]|nr:fimbrillin family protein [Bacteroidales bacterium]